MDVAPKLRSLRKDVINLPRERGSARPLIVLGCQRSGTNALVGCFEFDRSAKVYQERSNLNVPRRRRSVRDSVRYSLRLRPLPEVRERLERLPYPLAVLKPLAESHRIAELLATLPGARIVWLFRNVDDVAESNARVFGADVHRRNLEPMLAADPDDWRGAGVSERVREAVRRHYRPEMDPIDGGALFWWARNQLLFDQGGEQLDGVKAVRYERFVARPAPTLEELYGFTGVRFPGARLADRITPSFLGRGGESISAPLRELCGELWGRLCALDPAGERLDDPAPGPDETRAS